jgi:hypothetical protein
MCTILREEAAWRRGARGRKGRSGAEKRKKLRVLVWHGKQEMPMARARVSRTVEVILRLLSLELWAQCKVRWVWAGAVIYASATFSLQFAKASAATADVQRGRAVISGRTLDDAP